MPANYRPDPALPPDLEEKRQAAILWLGERWLLHPKHAPKKGDYDSWPKRQQEDKKK